jgi:hypothetical protein
LCAILEKRKPLASPHVPLAVKRWLLAVATLSWAHAAHAEPSEGGSGYEQGVRLRNVGEYADAASAFERFAREHPTDGAAPGALNDALVLRIGLGDDRAADQDTDQFLRAYGAHADEAAEVALSVLLRAADKDDGATIEREAPRRLPLIERGPIPLRMAAHAILGRAHAKHAGDPRATREYARVRELGKELKAPASDGAATRRFARALDALGEAVLFAADERRDAIPWPAFPGYAGGDVDGWLASKVTPWIAARSAAIRAVSDEYRKVTEIQPVPPPHRVVDAAARVAQMWSKASDEMFAGMSPRAPKAFRDKLAAAARPLRDAEAKPAAIACVAFSVKYQWVDGEARGCGAWLERTFPHEFPALDELAIVPPLQSFARVQAEPVPQ